ncbi:MAG TPA: Hsp20/alpha crystallin family protein [Patescibacteria group bacterium]|nr:Hsp20/alpha crystallin family protein [Patescibacteria group bacterium]
MPRKEKSFFGKIMGGDVTDVDLAEDEEVAEEPAVVDDDDELEDLEDEEDLDEEEEVNYVEAPLAPEAEDEEEEEDVEEMEVAVQGHDDEDPEPVAVGNAAVSAKDEEWMNDYEGALNIDMYQTKDNVIIKSTIAGVRPDDIDITVANDMVTIKGSRSREEKIVQDDYFYQECYWGSFSRSVIVPVDIDSEEIEADLKDGILTVIIPKAAKAKTKKVKVKGL